MLTLICHVRRQSVPPQRLAVQDDVPPGGGDQGHGGTLAPCAVFDIYKLLEQLHPDRDVRMFDFGAGGGNAIGQAILAFGFEAHGCELGSTQVSTSI